MMIYRLPGDFQGDLIGDGDLLLGLWALQGAVISGVISGEDCSLSFWAA